MGIYEGGNEDGFTWKDEGRMDGWKNDLGMDLLRAYVRTLHTWFFRRTKGAKWGVGGCVCAIRIAASRVGR